jgi:hypothetical protein
MKKDITLDQVEVERVRKNHYEGISMLIAMAAVAIGMIFYVLSTIRSNAYRYAYITLPTGQVIEGDIESLREYDDGKVEITIDGTKYTTSIMNAVIVNKGGNEND